MAAGPKRKTDHAKWVTRPGSRHCVPPLSTVVVSAIGTLTVFAFSSENWNRPASEVARLMDLFLRALDKETGELHKNDICLRFIGDKSAFKSNFANKNV